MRIKYIDVLKAFAIIAVVLYHTGLMTYGYLGVDLFLVVAGYLTTNSLYKSLILNRPGWGGYFTFEFSRVIRLLPLLLVAGLLCMLAGYIVMLPDDYENLSQSVIATNFFGNNILGAITTGNYWDVVNDYKPLMHTWYVGVLMQFYIVYPILFYLARVDKRNKRNPKATLLTMIAILAVISLFAYFATTDAAQRFYYLPSRFFEFAVGGIVALLYKPQENKPFGKGVVYVCYVFLLVLMFVNADVIPAIIRLVVVVGLSCALLCSQDVLENKITGNRVLAKIGVASYSIFIWHQILLAFYRYTITSKFTISSYVILLVGTALMSWLSYKFIEQGTTRALKSKSGKTFLYTVTAVVFVALSAFAGFIYMRAGVVRDVPELYIDKDNVYRGLHNEYNDRIYKLDKPFSTSKKHWLIVGDSFGRDFANVILESSIADEIEVSYMFMDKNNPIIDDNRLKNADKVFFAYSGVNTDYIRDIEGACQRNGTILDNLIVVGPKNFGNSNGQFYIKRWKTDYYEQKVVIERKYLELNSKLQFFCGNRYVDLIGLVIDKQDRVPVFTPDHHFVSQDCRHFSKGGAKWFAELVDFSKFM